jgi:hypothetical protein
VGKDGSEYTGARMPRKSAIRPPARGRDVVEVAHAKLGIFKGCPRRTIKFKIRFQIASILDFALKVAKIGAVQGYGPCLCYATFPAALCC